MGEGEGMGWMGCRQMGGGNGLGRWMGKEVLHYRWIAWVFRQERRREEKGGMEIPG